MSSRAGSLADGRHSSTDVPSLKFEHDGGSDDSRRHRLSTQPPSPQSSGFDANANTNANTNANAYLSNASAPLSADDDTPMTDATDATTTADKMARKTNRSPSSSITKKTRARGGVASTRGGGSLRGRGNTRGGGTTRASTRGGHRHLLKPRGGGSGGGVSRAKGARAAGGGGGGSSQSPSPSIKQESEAALSSDDDDDDDDNDANSGHSGNEHEGEVSDNGPYCICRGPDDHRWMIQCDQCEDWFHGDCVQINKELGENVVSSYICPNCTVPNRYVTRFRKLCALTTCRRPARLYAEDGASAASPAEISHFCSDTHRDQWWEAVLASLDRRKTGGAGGADGLPEDKMPVDQLTPAQLIALLASSSHDGVADLLLEGLTRDSSIDPDALLTDEERDYTSKSAAHRYHLAEQLVMCKKMLELLEMAKSRNYDAIKAGIIERDCCGYDDRLQHVGVQPHFGRFLTSPEGVAIFQAGQLGPPPADEAGQDKEDSSGSGANGANGVNGANGANGTGDAGADAPDADYIAATAGMCRRRKCKAHLGWWSTLARDVRMQMQELAREAAVQSDNETRIRLAAVQRAFVRQHMPSEVRFVDDSDNSLSSLSGGGPLSESEDNDDNGDEDDDDDNNRDSGHRRYAKHRSSSYGRSSRSSPGHGDDSGDSGDRDINPDYNRRNGHANGHPHSSGASPRSVATYSD